MNTSEGLRYRLEIDSFNSVYLISTWHEHPYIYLKSENLDRLYRFNTNTEKLYKWVQAYSSWDTMENKLIPVTADSIWEDRKSKTLSNANSEWYGD